MYIEINLLPLGFRPKKVRIWHDYRFLFTVAVIVAALGMAGYYVHLRQSIGEITTQVEFKEKERLTFIDRVQLDEEVKVLKEDIEKRVKIIKELTGDSGVRFAMLEHINLVIPENLWLLRIAESIESGKIAFEIEGMSYSKDNISEFLEGLEKFEKFTNVSLESIAPAPLEIRDAFEYTVKVEIAASLPPQEENEKRGPPRRSR